MSLSHEEANSLCVTKNLILTYNMPGNPRYCDLHWVHIIVGVFDVSYLMYLQTGELQIKQRANLCIYLE